MKTARKKKKAPEPEPAAATPTPPAAGRWRNRIVGHEDVAPDQILAHPDNWRVHPANQQEAMVELFDEIGWLEEVKINRTTGRLFDGHMRVTLALRHDEPTVPVTYYDLTEAEERLALATMNPIATLAYGQTDAVAALHAEIAARADGSAVGALLANVRAQAGILAGIADKARGAATPAEDSPESPRKCPHCGFQLDD